MQVFYTYVDNFVDQNSKRETPQAPGDATVLKRFFLDNFVIFRRRSKRIAFMESENFSTCDYANVQFS